MPLSSTPTPHRSPRIPLLRLTLAMAAVLLLTAAHSEAQAAGHCKKGKEAWKVEGRTVCVAAPGPGDAPTSEAAAVRRWVDSATGRSPARRARVPRTLRRALPRARKMAVQLSARVPGRAAGRAPTALRGGQSGHGPVVASETASAGVQHLEGGVTLEGTVRMREFADGTIDKQLEVEMRGPDGGAVTLSPEINDENERKVGCPDASGLVEWQHRTKLGGTVTVRRGRKVLSAVTQRDSMTTRARGHVGRDARLALVETQVEIEMDRYERGVQIERRLSGSYSTAREATTAAATAPPKATARIRVAGASAADERALEREVAARDAADADAGGSIPGAAVDARDRILGAEPTWYDVPNECASLSLTPAAPAHLAQGQAATVRGFVDATSGGHAAGRIDVTGVSRGTFAASRPATEGGSPALFAARGGAPEGTFRITVNADVLATSTAGRAEGGWLAEAERPPLPESFSGSVSATSLQSINEFRWSGTAEYERTSVFEGPDGSISAWYEISDGSLDASFGRIGVGCRWEATGSGSYIDAGDLEIRILPDGRRLYALMYDLKAPATFEPVDCPPDAGVQPFELDIPAYLHTRRPDQPDPDALRTAPADFHLAESDVGDVQPAGPEVTTTASWDLEPQGEGF